jgi:hypothetical protein
MYAAAMSSSIQPNDAAIEPEIVGLREVSFVANGVGDAGGTVLLRTLVAGGCKLLLDGIGSVIAGEVQSLQADDPNFTELRAADNALSMSLEHIAASIGQQHAAIGGFLPPLPAVSSSDSSSSVAFSVAVSSHIPQARAPFVSLLAFVVPRSPAHLDIGALRAQLLQKATDAACKSREIRGCAHASAVDAPCIEVIATHRCALCLCSACCVSRSYWSLWGVTRCVELRGLTLKLAIA